MYASWIFNVFPGPFSYLWILLATLEKFSASKSDFLIRCWLISWHAHMLIPQQKLEQHYTHPLTVTELKTTVFATLFRVLLLKHLFRFCVFPSGHLRSSSRPAKLLNSDFTLSASAFGSECVWEQSSICLHYDDSNLEHRIVAHACCLILWIP